MDDRSAIDLLPLPSVPRILLLAMLPIGDALFITPTIRAIRQRYPAASLIALTKAGSAGILKCVGDLDDVFTLPVGGDWRGTLELTKLLAYLRTQRFDVAVDFTSPAYKWVSMAAGIPFRTYMKFDSAWWFVPGEHRHWRFTHATRHYYDCAAELDLPPWGEVDHTPRISLPATARAEAARYLAERGLAARGERQSPLVVLHAGGAGLDGLKRWPIDRFAAVADALVARWSARVVLIGGPDEATLDAKVAALTRQPVANAAGQLSLLGTAALIEAADLFVGNDSSPLHLAAAMGTRFVGIYGPTGLANFRPIPVRSRQGRFALPPYACGSPQHFVGAAPIWNHACCEGTCAALLALDPQTVIDQAEAHLVEAFPRLLESVTED